VNETDLREIYRPPSTPALRKQIDLIDQHCRTFIAHSPFVLVGTAAADGTCDVSPKGGPPGFVAVLDEHRLAVPDLAGNNRLDSMRSLVVNPGIGLLFLVPGLDETLRVNGTAEVTIDDDVLDACALVDVRPRVAIVVTAHECFIHCAKAFRRGGVWKPESWPDRSDMPSVACMLRDHAGFSDVDLTEMETALEDNYRRTLWQPGGEPA